MISVRSSAQRWRALLLPFLAALFASACASPPKEPREPSEPTASAEPAPPPQDEPTTTNEKRADGAACTRGDECESGVCEGEGCGVDEGRCAPERRPCTKDLVNYCGCDGQTFAESGSCPGRTYAARGRCEGDPASSVR